jgi:hypothetical protein
MRAQVSSVMTIDHGSLAAVQFDDPTDAAQWVRVIAGPDNGPGEESFDLFVCTPRWLQKKVQDDGPVIGIHHVIAGRWVADQVEAFVRSMIESEIAEDWAHLGDRIGRLAHWEFDSYRPLRGRPH